MKEILTSIWKWLDGNKTIISAFIWILIIKGIIPLDANWQYAIEWLLGVITGGAFIDHARKGYLTTEKGS